MLVIGYMKHFNNNGLRGFYRIYQIRWSQGTPETPLFTITKP